MALEEVAGVVLRVLVMMGTPPHSPLHYSAAQIWPSEGPGAAAAADRLTGWGGARRSEGGRRKGSEGHGGGLQRASEGEAVGAESGGGRGGEGWNRGRALIAQETIWRLKMARGTTMVCEGGDGGSDAPPAS